MLIDDKTRRKYDREIRNPSGWVSGDGDFVGQSGEINVKVILVALGICVAVMAYVAFKFLNVQVSDVDAAYLYAHMWYLQPGVVV